MSKIIRLILAVAIVAAGVIFLPRVLHTCDDCENFFFGTGYEPNIVSDILSEEDQVICKDCAEDQHAVSIALGKSVEDFKRPLFDEE